MNRIKKHFITGTVLFALFIVFTVLVKVVDTASIGPDDTIIGFSSINVSVFKFLGESKGWFYVTEVLGIISILVAGAFAVYGLVQLIQRKSLKKVDYNILTLAIFYIIVVIFYAWFEVFVVNYRPVLVDGVIEASYPSSHTVLSVFILGSAMIQFHKIFEGKSKLLFALDATSFTIIGFTVVGRLLSGMHWITDIFGGLLLSVSLIFIYYAALKYVENWIQIKKIKKDLDE